MTALRNRFLAGLPFPPDPFQLQALESLERGRGVLVTAPTGSGKTMVAEAAVFFAQANGRRAFYTTPIKALSNQKYGDLCDTYGKGRVGLLTGDNSINGDAPIVVMTTEVLRNMIYVDPTVLDDVEYVVLDEVHYLQDRFRGPVWEEIIIHAPAHVKLVCLSATIANSEEFAKWMVERRGAIDLVTSDRRPVPLERLYAMSNRNQQGETRLWPLFAGNRKAPNPSLQRLISLDRGSRSRFTAPRRLELVAALEQSRMLPAIYFIFSRSGCDAAARELVSAGMRLATDDDRERIRQVVEAGTAHLGDGDLRALDYPNWLAGLEVGVATHHAGMVPAFKEVVEGLFSVGLIKVVFATETLALGINMPARTVVLDSLTKFDGEGHSMMTPGDYTQLTGRAGRRGIDTIGYGVVLHSRFVRFDQVVEVASSGSHPLRSSFRPNYNMAANLVANYRKDQVEGLLAASFAQFLMEGSGVEMANRLEALEATRVKDLQAAECELGSVRQYAEEIERGGGAALEDRLHPGDVVEIPGGPRQGRFVIVRRVAGSKRASRFLAISTSGRTANLAARDLVGGSRRVGSIPIDPSLALGDRRSREAIRRKLRNVRPENSPPEVRHPISRCPDANRHLVAFRRVARTERRIEQMRDQLRKSGHGLVEEFEGIRALLEAWKYLDGWSLTPRGRRLRMIYNESDLLLSESLEQGLFWDLDPAETAALASVFVYEPRSDEPSLPHFPTEKLSDRWKGLQQIAERLGAEERSRKLSVSTRIDPGFAHLAFSWTKGTELADLPGNQAAAGDFVRVSRQLVDLLRQIREVMPENAAVVTETLRALDRGVVAATGAR